MKVLKVSELEDLILKNASKINLTRGKDIIASKKLSKLNVHKVGKEYNIYGNFKNDKNSFMYNPHMKINLMDKKITYAKCGCEMFSEVHGERGIYLCEHLVAIGLSFVNTIKVKLNAKTQKMNNTKDDKIILQYLKDIMCKEDSLYKKEKLTINVSIKENLSNKETFTLSFFVGNSSMYPVININDFVYSVIKMKEYYIGKGLVYKPENYYFDEEDMKLIEYLYEYCLIYKNEKNNMTLDINKEVIGRLLIKLGNKKIKFVYGYQTYTSEIINHMMPVSFTLKTLGDNYVLTTKKDFPLPLNEREDVFLFDRKIYIPNSKQKEVYKLLRKELKEKGRLIFSNAISSYELLNLVESLKLICNDINLDKAIIEKLDSVLKIEFNFEKDNDKLCCNVFLKYDGKKISYEEALKSDDEVIKNSRKLLYIELELNKSLFFYRNGRFVFSGSDDEYYNFLKEKIDQYGTFAEINIDERCKKYFSLNKDISIDVDLKENKDENFKFSFNMQDIDHDNFMKIIEGYKEKKSYIKLNDGIYIDLKDPQLIKFIKLLESLNIDLNEKRDSYLIELNKIQYLCSKLDESPLYNIRNKDVVYKIIERLEHLKDAEFNVPKDLKCTLRNYQINGFKWLKSLAYLNLGGILSDEMGLGKTVQIISFLLSEKNKQSLVIIPTSLLYNWVNEFNKFAPDLNIKVVHGNATERKNIIDEYENHDVLLTTYGTIRNDHELYENKLFDYIILDEGQNINNHKAAITQIIKELKGKSRFILTGTPIENNLLELWSLFDFIMPGYLYSKEEFSSKFMTRGSDNMDELKSLINPYILRRTKKDVALELPKKHEENLLVNLTEDQEALYKTYISDVKNKIKNNEINNNVTLFSYLTKLRMICLDPSIMVEDYMGGSVKIETAKKIIFDKMDSHKILLFSQFTSVLKKLKIELERENIDYCYLDGSISSKNRMKLVNEFNNEEKKRVFLISLKAGGTGLNLMSADIVIHFDPWWNPSIHEQASDRAHRIGQRNTVEVIKLVARDTIEEKIVMLQEDKKYLISEVISGELKEDNIMHKLNKDEILKLFY